MLIKKAKDGLTMRENKSLPAVRRRKADIENNL